MIYSSDYENLIKNNDLKIDDDLTRIQAYAFTMFQSNLLTSEDYDLENAKTDLSKFQIMIPLNHQSASNSLSTYANPSILEQLIAAIEEFMHSTISI